MRQALGALLLAACATAGARAQHEPPIAPGGQTGATPSAAGAEADLRSAVTRFSHGDTAGARVLLEALLPQAGEGPLRVTTATLLARIALAHGDAGGARTLLDTHARGAS